MSSFSELKKAKGRQIIIDFPYDDTEIKVCLKVLSVIEDLTAATKAREYAKQQGVEDINDKQPEYSLRLMAEIVARCTYECVKVKDEWQATDRKFFANADEILEGLDQDCLLFVHEYYQNFRSISSKNQEFTPENIAVISHEMGGEGDEEKRANFFYHLPRHSVYSYVRFTASLVKNAAEKNFLLTSSAITEPTNDSPV
jgi:hypothetical protein